ncbi:hypothetical protein L596_015978 [Steinernema carpocapsae]|uniref:Uncharacterized protein n=1 Tax=Steinernema carpocapsae TaxID=34508 RepID=A0A4U5NHN5_STECR|nr:hypothetical protein L596_015978 [Steinernema carpocapsae]
MTHVLGVFAVASNLFTTLFSIRFLGKKRNVEVEEEAEVEGELQRRRAKSERVRAPVRCPILSLCNVFWRHFSTTHTQKINRTTRKERQPAGASSASSSSARERVVAVSINKNEPRDHLTTDCTGDRWEFFVCRARCNLPMTPQVFSHAKKRRARKVAISGEEEGDVNFGNGECMYQIGLFGG